MKNQKLNQLQILKKRSVLDFDLEKELHRENTGFIGEKMLADILERELIARPIQIFDYRFEVDGNERQIDCLLIFQYECVLLEVKNYVGEYTYDKGEMYFSNSKERLEQQPFSQIETTKSMLKKHFEEQGIRMKITEKVVFINKNFYMYNDSEDLPAVYVPTTSKFLLELNRKNCQLNDKHQNILEKLMASKVTVSKYYVPVQCEFEVLKKGVTCNECSGWMELEGRKKMICNNCERNESMATAIIRATKEFKTLFPDKKITTSVMLVWIDYKVSRSTLYKILNKNFRAEGSYKDRHYILDEDRVK